MTTGMTRAAVALQAACLRLKATSCIAIPGCSWVGVAIGRRAIVPPWLGPLQRLTMESKKRTLNRLARGLSLSLASTYAVV